MSGLGLDTPYWGQDAVLLSAALGSGPGGLSSEQAAAKLRLVGPNTVEDASHLSALRVLLRQFESPLVLILIFAAAMSLVLQQCQWPVLYELVTRGASGAHMVFGGLLIIVVFAFPRGIVGGLVVVAQALKRQPKP